MVDFNSFVKLVWLDSCEARGWVEADAVFNQKPMEVVSIGWLLRSPDDEYPYYCIVRDVGSNGDVCGALEIPESCVVEYQEYDI